MPPERGSQSPLARHRENALNLADSKTGPRAVPLGKAARAIIDALPGKRRPSAFLFPKLAEGRYSHSLVVCWRAVCEDAKLGRLRLQDLRHTTASQAVMAGENLPLVGKLLGHRRHRTTAGYAHVADGHLVEAAEKVESIIAKAMLKSASFNYVALGWTGRLRSARGSAGTRCRSLSHRSRAA